MNRHAISRLANPLSTLQRLAQARRVAEERCDFCSLRLAPLHRHLLEVAPRRMVCVCDACALTFHGVVGGRFKAVPRSPRALPDFRLTDAQWQSLGLPIDLAFIFQSSPQQEIVALYPSPAGVTESQLLWAQWTELVTANPELARLEADVEALLVNRIGAAREYYVAPMDWCFELAGRIRLHWRGLSGGSAVWREVGKFFERLRLETGHTPPGEPPGLAAAMGEEVSHA